jgi:ADP-ribose pyrophosphatase
MSDVNQQGITFSKNDVEIIARETLYRGFFARFISFSPSPV